MNCNQKPLKTGTHLRAVSWAGLFWQWKGTGVLWVVLSFDRSQKEWQAGRFGESRVNFHPAWRWWTGGYIQACELSPAFLPQSRPTHTPFTCCITLFPHLYHHYRRYEDLWASAQGSTRQHIATIQERISCSWLNIDKERWQSILWSWLLT